MEDVPARVISDATHLANLEVFQSLAALEASHNCP